MKHNRSAAKKQKAADIEQRLSRLQRELIAARANVTSLLGRFTAMEDEAEELRAKTDELTTEVELNKEKYLAKKHEADELRRELEATEVRLSELEDDLQEYQDEEDLSEDSKTRRRAQEDADADYEEETGESRTGGREHGFETREAILMYLALGIAPSRIVPAMGIAKFDFKGLVPTLRLVQNMRKELRVAVCILAAATAADPKV